MKVEPETLTVQPKPAIPSGSSDSLRGEKTEQTPAVQQDGGSKLATDGDSGSSPLRSVLQRVAGILVNALNFAMGFGWFGLANVISTSGFPGDPKRADAGVHWACAVVVVIVCVPLMGLLLWRHAVLERRAVEAHRSGYTDLAVRLQVQAASVQTLMSWGLAFTVAGQIDSAAKASLPTSPWGWRALYTSVMLLIVTFLAFTVAVSGHYCACCCGESVHSAVADAIVAGAAYGIAMAFFGTVTAAFRVEEVGMFGGSEDLGYLAMFTVVTLVLASIVLAVLACIERAASGGQERASGPEQGRTLPSRLGTIMHKLVAKTISMCSVVALYALVYVALSRTEVFGAGAGRGSVYQPLQLEGAVLFLFLAVVAALVGGGLLGRLLQGLGKHLARVDRELVPGPLDDAVLDSLERLTSTTAAALATALAWLVGMAVHACATSIWDLFVAPQQQQDSEELNFGAQVVIAFGYAAVVSIVAIAATTRCAPPAPGL